MPRSYSSRGVLEGGAVASPPVPFGIARRRRRQAARLCATLRQTGLRPGRRHVCAVGKVERLAGAASAGRTDGAIGRHRQPSAAERLRRTGRIGALVWIERIAAAPPGPRRFLRDRRGACDLSLRIGLLLRLAVARLLLLAIARLRLGLRVATLGRRLVIAGAGLRRRHGRHIALARRSRRGPAELPQPLFELAVAVLQFLVLAGELAQLVLQLLDAHFRVGVIRLRQGLRGYRKSHGDRRDARHFEEFGRHFALTKEIGPTSASATDRGTEYAKNVTGDPNPTLDRALSFSVGAETSK